MNVFDYLKESFNYFRRSLRVAYGFLSNLPALLNLSQPVVTIFGSAKIDKQSVFYAESYALGRKLAENNISVITGGGPGIMQAANMGAASIELEQHKKITRTLGIAVRGIDQCFDVGQIPLITLRYFFMRKWFLTRFSCAFIIFPGGIGTMDELFDVLNLRKHAMLPVTPVILIGKDYWQPLIRWFNDSALKQGMIDDRLIQLFMVTDSVEEAFALVQEACKKNLGK